MEENNVQILPDDYAQSDLSFKVIIIGDSSVGKSSITMKGVKNIFQDKYSATVGFEFFTFNVKINDETVVKLQIWDTCGQEIYRSLITSFYRNSAMAFIVYSIDNYESFRNIDHWLKDLKNQSSPDIKVFLIGNKKDLQQYRRVKTEEGEKFKEDNKLDYFTECSALTGLNTQEIFLKAANILYNEHSNLKKMSDVSHSFISGYPQNKTSLAHNENMISFSNLKITPDNNKKDSSCSC